MRNLICHKSVIYGAYSISRVGGCRTKNYKKRFGTRTKKTIWNKNYTYWNKNYQQWNKNYENGLE